MYNAVYSTYSVKMSVQLSGWYNLQEAGRGVILKTQVRHFEVRIQYIVQYSVNYCVQYSGQCTVQYNIGMSGCPGTHRD